MPSLPKSPTAPRCGRSRKSAITAADYTDFYRSIAGQFDEPALTIHFHAEGRHDYTSLFFVPGSRPFDLFDPDRKGRIKLYVKRVFITDDADILPRYLRFIRGLVDCADLPLNVSREKIQESPLLAAIRKGATSRVLGELERLADKEPEAYTKIWDLFGAVLKEGVYEDFERRDALLALARFKTTGPADTWRSLKDYVAAFKTQPDRDLLSGRRQYRAAEIFAASGRLPGARHRGAAAGRSGRFVLGDVGAVVRRQAVQVGDAGRGRSGAHCAARCQGSAGARAADTVKKFLAFMKSTLGEPSPKCARPNGSPTARSAWSPRMPGRTGAGADPGRGGRLNTASKPILEVNPRHQLVVALAGLGGDQRT